MDLQKAKAIMTAGFPGLTPVSCVEYDSVFVFDMRPKGQATLSNVIDSLVSINKTTGVISDFKPFMLSGDEYNRGIKRY
jgi:hypothetical protein